jgi:hypothetical protein
MADRDTHRRAAIYRSRAHGLAESAQREPFEDRRRHIRSRGDVPMRCRSDGDAAGARKNPGQSGGLNQG